MCVRTSKQVGEILTSKKQRKPAVEIQALGVEPVRENMSQYLSRLRITGIHTFVRASKVYKLVNMRSHTRCEIIHMNL